MEPFAVDLGRGVLLQIAPVCDGQVSSLTSSSGQSTADDYSSQHFFKIKLKKMAVVLHEDWMVGHVSSKR